jgi:hypothetical protein
MTLGLMNAGATFQRKVDRALAHLEGVFAYVDDMDVASKDAEEHTIHLRQLFTHLREHGLVINAEKSCLGEQHQVSEAPPVGGRGGAYPSPHGGGGGLSQAVNSQGAGISGQCKFLPPIPARGGDGVEAAHRLLEGRAQGCHHYQLGGQHGQILQEGEASSRFSRPASLPRPGGKVECGSGCVGDAFGGMPAAAMARNSGMGAASFFFKES